MQSTKHQILELLKRTGSATVEEAAGALAVASMTARQHLVGLERDGLIQSEKVRRATGRPHFLYTLTPKGDEMFPRRFDLLAQLILDEAGNLEGSELDNRGPMEKRMLLMERVVDRLVERQWPLVEGRGLVERIARTTELLQTIGGFAEWCPTDAGYEIRDYNCVFSCLVEESAGGCPWHIRLLARLLDRPVVHEVVSNGRVHCCRYLVTPDEDEPGEED